MFFLFNLFLVYGTINYDSGYFIKFDRAVDSTMECLSGSSYTQIINFSGTFSNTPEILLIHAKSDLENADPVKQTEVVLDIGNITTTQFQIALYCPQRKVWGLRYRWYAIDDQRIEVLSFFHLPNVQNTTFPHKNPNALTGFISLISICYQGRVAFNISITSITSTNVSIQISDPQSSMGSLLKLGFQIILGAPEQLKLLDTIRVVNFWTSPVITLLPDSYFMIPLIGVEYDNTYIWRLNTTYSTNIQFTYTLDDWGGNYATNSHQQVQLLYVCKFQLFFYYNLTYLPLFCNHFEVIQKVDPSPTQYTSVRMFILEINQQFISTGTEYVILEKQLSVVNLEITVNCQQNQNIQSTFYFYISQKRLIQEKNHIYSCSPQYSIIKYNSRFKQQTSAASKLQIVITSNSLIITQIIYNQVISEQQLVAMEII